jgi:formate--tetrahydrofolate ligase
VIVVFNRFATDTDEEMALLRNHCENELGLPFVINNAFALGGEGAVEMAQIVVDTIENNPSKKLEFTYCDEDSIQTKIEKVAKNIYGAASVTFAKPALDRIKLAEKYGLAKFPVCIAKTQFSFSADAKQYGAVKGFNLQIRDVVLNAGAEMIVAIAGDIIRMPGLPKDPQANHIDFVDGEIVGLS